MQHLDPCPQVEDIMLATIDLELPNPDTNDSTYLPSKNNANKRKPKRGKTIISKGQEELEVQSKHVVKDSKSISPFSSSIR